MKQVLKALFVLFVTAVCLTSDTALSSTAVKASVQKLKVQRSELRSSMNCVGFAASGQRHLYWECRNWTPRQGMRPSGSRKP